MKILKRGDEFRKVSEDNMQQIKAVNNLISQGWNYCSKKVYKDFNRIEKPTEKVEKLDILKTKTTAKERRTEQKKISK